MPHFKENENKTEIKEYVCFSFNKHLSQIFYFIKHLSFVFIKDIFQITENRALSRRTWQMYLFPKYYLGSDKAVDRRYTDLPAVKRII